MSISGSQGFVGLATQSALGAAPQEGAYTYFEAIAAPMVPRDLARARRPTIGDQPLPRNAYKVGTSVSGSLGIEATPNALGQLLYLLLGHADAPDVDGDAQDHVLRFNPADQYAIPYFRARRGVGTQILESAADCKFAQAVLTFAPGDSVQAALNYQGRIPSQALTYPAAASAVQNILFDVATTSGAFTLVTDAGESGSITFSATAGTMASNIQTALVALYGVGAVTCAYDTDHYEVTWGAAELRELMSIGASSLNGDTPVLAHNSEGSAGITYDDGPVLVVGSDDADVTLETDVGLFQGAADGVITMGVEMTFSNMLTPPTRLRIGSPYPIDFTLLDRDVQIRIQLEIDNPTLYRKVFNAGGSV